VSDASFAAGWIATHLGAQVARRRFLFARGLGGLGYAIPAAIGAATATERGRVITVSGDGGASYALGELATHAQHGLDSTHVVLNNGALGWLKVWQHLFFDGLSQSVELESDTGRASFAGVARALGCAAHLVTEPIELSAVFDEAKATTGPTLIEVRCQEWATPVHGYRRRLAAQTTHPRPGTVYEARAWLR
jgi:acetolactate synthase-1/2/3 large subunit